MDEDYYNFIIKCAIKKEKMPLKRMRYVYKNINEAFPFKYCLNGKLRKRVCEDVGVF